LSGGITIFTDAVTGIVGKIFDEYAEADAVKAEREARWAYNRKHGITGLETPPDLTEANKHALDKEVEKTEKTEKALTFVTVGIGAIAAFFVLKG
jgi:hypothetical protein